MKFEAEDPAEVAKSGSGSVNRSQGAARAISVWFISYLSAILLKLCTSRLLIQG